MSWPRHVPYLAVHGSENSKLGFNIQPKKNTTNSNIIPRAGSPDEVATGIIFAIENEFITGTTIDIDGGWLIS